MKFIRLIMFVLIQAFTSNMVLSSDPPSVPLSFSVKALLPYSIKLDEVLIQDILISNTLSSTQTVEVKIAKDPHIEGANLSKFGWEDSNEFYFQNVKSNPGKQVNLKFAVKPKTLGHASFNVTATGPLANSHYEGELHIIHKGVSRSVTKSHLITLNSATPQFSSTLNCKIPNSAYDDTVEVHASIAGDLFGVALNHLDKIIGLPIGCGEQQIITLAPAIAIYFTLILTGRLPPDLKGPLEEHITDGYQNALAYQRSDGSFSPFGETDPFGSTFVTTVLVGNFFYVHFILGSVDPLIMKRGADFVVNQQLPDGSFKENGRIIHTDMQGRNGNGIALTAFCTLFFSIILPVFPEYTAARDKAVVYMENGFSSASTTYELAIMSYVLAYVSSSKANQVFDLLNDRKIDTGKYIYWKAPSPPNPDFWYENEPRSIDIETTAYALLAYTRRAESLSQMLKIANYLINEITNTGGYSSTQDSVMAFYALSEFGKLYFSSTNVQLILAPNAGSNITASVSSLNNFGLQSFDLNSEARNMGVTATTVDSGLAIVSLSCSFYEDPDKVPDYFKINHNFQHACNKRLEFDVCARNVPNGNLNMAVMIVTLPSGFVFDGSVTDVIPNVSKIEVEELGSQVIYYFNNISKSGSCAAVKARKDHTVTGLQEGSIEVVDYYDSTKQGSSSLKVPGL